MNNEPTPYSHLTPSYHLGLLKGFLKFLPYGNIPGVELTMEGRQALNRYLTAEIERMDREAARFNVEGWAPAKKD
jgi:hypothetical protein